MNENKSILARLFEKKRLTSFSYNVNYDMQQPSMDASSVYPKIIVNARQFYNHNDDGRIFIFRFVVALDEECLYASLNADQLLILPKLASI